MGDGTLVVMVVKTVTGVMNKVDVFHVPNMTNCVSKKCCKMETLSTRSYM